jgi:hypothetical protein
VTTNESDGHDLQRADPFADIGAGLRKLAVWWEANKRTIYEGFAWTASSYVMAEKLARTGWLPHYSTPDLMVELGDEATDAQIAGHYDANWAEVERAFHQRLAGYNIDDEAKACFREALACHGHKLYRVAPRLLFPEIERVFRSELGEVITVNAGLKWLREAANSLGSENFIRTGVLTGRLYQAFSDQVYSLAETPDQIARAQADPVPNRHASIHGLVVYNSQKASMNALIIAEFVLLTVSVVRAQSIEMDGIEVQARQQSLLDQFATNPPFVAGNRDWRRLERPGGAPADGSPEEADSTD